MFLLLFIRSEHSHFLMRNGVQKDSSRTDVYQLQQRKETNEDYNNEGNKSTDRLMDIKEKKTNATSFLRPTQKSDLSSEEGSENGSDTKSKKNRKKGISLTYQSQKRMR